MSEAPRLLMAWTPVSWLESQEGGARQQRKGFVFLVMGLLEKRHQRKTFTKAVERWKSERNIGEFDQTNLVLLASHREKFFLIWSFQWGHGIRAVAGTQLPQRQGAMDFRPPMLKPQCPKGQIKRFKPYRKKITKNCQPWDIGETLLDAY